MVLRSSTNKTDNLTYESIHDNYTCEKYRFANSHQSLLIWIFYIARKDCHLYIKCFEIPGLILVSNLMDYV